MLRRGLAQETVLRLLEAVERLDSKVSFEDRFYRDFCKACTKRYGLDKGTFKQMLYTNVGINDSEYVFWLKLSDVHEKLVCAIDRCRYAPKAYKNQMEEVKFNYCMQGIRFLHEYYNNYGIDPKSIKSVYGTNLSPSLVAYF